MEKVSVIIPTYNRCEKLKAAIDSVLNQTYKEFELLIVDDGSIDNTQEMVEAIADERVRYIKLSQNMGAGGARNEGVKQAKADIIAFHDSDDLWRPNKLEKQMKYLEEHPEFGMVYCAFEHHRENKCVRMPEEHWDILEGDLLERLLVRNQIGTPTMVFRKNCFMEIGGFDITLRCLEDWEMVLRFAESYLIGYVDEVLVDTYLTQGSVTNAVRGVGAYFETRCLIIVRNYKYLVKYNLIHTVLEKLAKDAEEFQVKEEVMEMLKSFLLMLKG